MRLPHARKEIYERLYPETRHGAIGNGREKSRQNGDSTWSPSDITDAEDDDEQVLDHFPRVVKMVELGSGATREVEDIELTRLACYLIAYLETATTKALVAELESDLGIPRALLIESKATGPYAERGTWVHPLLAMQLAQWCSSRFAVVASKWLWEKVSGTGLRPMTCAEMRLLERFNNGGGSAPFRPPLG